MRSNEAINALYKAGVSVASKYGAKDRGFFSNVGANNPIKRVIDTIKNASLNDKIKTYDEMIAFADLLEQIFKDIEHDIRNGKFTFEYTTRSKRFGKDEIMISLENSESDDEK